jgi:hypothetical protein
MKKTIIMLAFAAFLTGCDKAGSPDNTSPSSTPDTSRDSTSQTNTMGTATNIPPVVP